MNYSILFPILIAFLVSVVLSPLIIPILRRLKFGQYIRGEGPKWHQKKSGTPTMGGLIILISISITSIFYIKDYPKIVPVLLLTLGFGLVGFVDDYIKIIMKRNLGLKSWQKMLGQLIITGLFAYYMVSYSEVGTSMLIPFSNGKYLDFGILYIPVLFFIVIGTVNGANFTDGLDGLASSVTVLIAVFFTVVAIGTKSGIEPITCCAVGAILGFLVYNVYPAKVFMGDTGSLAIGGFVAGTAFMLQMPLFLVLVAFIYFAEVLSVIIQVASFKTTGKRVFKMAPIHHHFEMCGWPETKVVAMFSILTAVLCLVALLAI